MKIKNKLIKILFTTVLLLSTTKLFAVAQSNTERFQVAIIPSSGEDLSYMLQAHLGKDKRFILVAEKDIPKILEEWERRQSGITENFDTSDLMIKNIDFFVELANVNVMGPVKKINTYTDSNNNTVTKVTYETSVIAQVKVTKIKEGGETEIQNVNSSATDENYQQSRISAIAALQGKVSEALKRLFPIVSSIFDVRYGTLKIGKGSNQGVEKGQRYILKYVSEINTGNAVKKVKEDAGLIEISKVKEEYAEANILKYSMPVNAQDQSAVEKYYARATFEIYSALANYAPIESTFSTKDLTTILGFKLFYGNIGQIGFGMDFLGVDPYSRIGINLELRYNIHLVRSHFLTVGSSLGFQMLSASTNMRVPDTNTNYLGVSDKYGNITTSDTLSVSSMRGSASFYGGWKYLLGENLYSIIGGEYLFAQSTGSWKYTKSKDTKPPYNDSIEDYSNYIKQYNPSGYRFFVNIGYYY